MDPEKKPDGNEMVSVSKFELAEIIRLNKELMERGSTGNPLNRPKETKVTDRTVTVMFVDEKPVIGYVNKGSAQRPIYIYEKQDPVRPTEYIAYVDVVLLGVDKPKTLNYVEFLQQADRTDCKILKKEEKEWTISQGTTVGRRFVEGTYHMVDTDALVPVEIKGKTSVFTVELPDKSSTEIHERYVNISK